MCYRVIASLGELVFGEYVCGEYKISDEPDRQFLEYMGFKWPTAGLLQMAIWEEMKEYGVDQNTISDSSR